MFLCARVTWTGKIYTRKTVGNTLDAWRFFASSVVIESTQRVVHVVWNEVEYLDTS